MNNRNAVVMSALLAVAMLFYFGKRDGEELSLPQCEFDQVVETPVHFFADESLSEERVNAWLEYANVVLENSCVPLKRTLSGIERIDLQAFTSVEEGQLHRQLVTAVGEQVLEPMQRTGHYYVLVLPNGHKFSEDGLIGTAHVNFSRSFAVLVAGADVHILEHELGHLAWAWHNDTPDYWLKGQLLDEFHPYIKSYARGYLCGDAGTVMTYASNQLPIYSSPKIRYFGQVCGDEAHADNARLMQEFARSLM
ncbi:hypothetical protein TW81_10020 [Vibrio galatheae]|uniref:Uncharacterized protein n=1 Tax=Vibrio galatheae TaxID=579748 RepID=A0A0F4NMJ2_9VIBR|nr:hypothetical protein [Vibrio galatheae]KJY83321.1 hypothetical protein TW81_10020 [Vibrio galatheae]